MSLSKLKSYPCQTATLQFLPIESRLKLLKKAPSVRTREATLPFRFDKIAIREVNREMFVSFDNLKFRICRSENSGSVTEVTVSMNNNTCVSGSVLRIGGLSIVDVLHNIIDFFFNRPGTIIRLLDIGYGCLNLFENRPKLRINGPVVIRRYSKEDDLVFPWVHFETPLLKIKGFFHLLRLWKIIAMVNESRRAIGKNLGMVGTGSSYSNAHVFLLDVFNLSRGSALGIDPVSEDGTEKPCVFFEMDHADFVVGSLIRAEKNVNFFTEETTMRIVEKGSVEKCERERWMRLLLGDAFGKPSSGILRNK